MSGMDSVLRRVESMGMSGTERHWGLIPPDMAKRTRPQVARVGDGLVTLMPTSDSLRLNRVVGLGHRGEASEAMVDTIIERYRSARVKRFTVLLGPGPQAAEIERWLLRRRFTRRGGYALLLRDCRKPVPRAGRAHREAVGRILGEAFA